MENGIMPHTVLWTWDGRMCWGGKGRLHHNITSAEVFLSNYKNLVDFMSVNGIATVIVWGFLREEHGGVVTSQKLCDYAAKKGVRIIPGVGVRSYGGFCYETGRREVTGETARWSLDQWLRKHPKFRAVDEKGEVRWWSHGNGDLEPYQHCDACPSRLELRDWYLEGIEWLYENFQIGGVWLEMGDNELICQCSQCVKRRGRQPDRGFAPLSYEDEALWMPVIAQKALNINPDSWVLLCQNLFYNQSMVESPPELIKAMPRNSIVAWHVYDPKVDIEAVHRDCEANPMWAQRVPPPEPRKKGEISVWAYGGQIHLVGIDGWPHHRQIARAVQHGREMGHTGICFYGEIGDNAGVTGNSKFQEINYLAMSEFCQEPDLTIEEFEARHSDLMARIKKSWKLLQ